MTEAQEVESLDRVLTRLALTDEKDLEKVRRLWPTHAFVMACIGTMVKCG